MPRNRELGMPLVGTRRAAFNLLNERVYSAEYRVVPVTKCFCGVSRFELLSRFDRYGLPFGTQICLDCGLISQTRNLDESAMKSFYNDIYWDLIVGDRPSSFTTTQASFETFLDMLLPHIPAGAKTVYEVGVGAGERLARLGERMSPRPKLVGCDYSEAALSLSKEKGIDGRLGGFETLKGNEKADVLVLSHIVEHLVDLDGALADIREITHENSVVYVEVPGVNDLPNKPEYFYDYQDYNIIAHIHNFSLDTLAGVFAKGGFGLVAGNEYARAVFKRSEPVKTAPPGRAYKATIAALAAAEKNAAAARKGTVRRLKTAVRSAASSLLK